MEPKLIDLPFPVRGMNAEDAFGTQVPGTTPLGVNVRLFEPSTDRARGGSRPGLIRLVQNQQLPLAAALPGGIE
jgi:hypothetical protein